MQGIGSAVVDQDDDVFYNGAMEKKGQKKDFDMEVFIERSDDKALCTIHGEIDTQAGLELSERFQEIVENEGIISIVLDLSDVHNITSAGIGKILKLLKYLNGRGGTMTIKGISPGLNLLFKEIHLDKIIPIEEK